MEYLQKRANSWYVRLAIPSDLLVQFAPKKELVRSMKTPSLTLARKLAHSAISEIQQTFFQMRYSQLMAQKPISKKAIEIFIKQCPGKDPFEFDAFAPPSPDTWIKVIQDYLNLGYEPDNDGNFDTSKPLQNEPTIH